MTFVFTDIEGSTRLFQDQGERWHALLGHHNRILRDAIAAHGGAEVKTEGDAFFVAFSSARAAVAACLDAQLALAAHPWPTDAPIRVRMGVHTGEAVASDGDYVSLTVHQAARVASAGHGGQVLVSAATTQLLGDVPGGAGLIDLGDHLLKDLAHPVRLFQLSHDELEHDFPPVRSMTRRLDNLPESLTSFVGRGAEVEELIDLLATERLVTLAGAGGSGKTRLSLEVGRAMRHKFSDGVWFVDLAGSAGDGVVVERTAAAVELRSAEQPTLVGLAEFLRGKSLLLILDNCEHLLRACSELAHEVTSRAADVRVIATSREPLGVRGERVWAIPSLNVEPDGDAVELFVDRAERSAPRLRLDDRDRFAVARICARLDGLPLAIELAAARCRVLSVEQIASRLDDRFRLLTGGSQRDLGRQQTLRATVDWSHDLLDDGERVLLRRLSVFAGGATLDAIEAVCPGGEIDVDDIVDLLTRLADKSMIVVDESAFGPRYRMLETIRDYAMDKLVHSGEADALRAAHLRWVAALAHEAEPNLWGSNDQEWLQRIDADIDNVRAALAWACASAPAQALTICADLLIYWWLRALFEESCAFVDTAAAALGETEDRDSLIAAARAHAVASFGAFHLDDREKVDRHATATLEIDERLGHPHELTRSAVWTTIDHAELVLRQGDHVTTAEMCDAALARAKSTPGEEYAQARALQWIAAAKHADDRVAALAVLEEALALCRGFDNNAAICRILGSMVHCHQDLGDSSSALRAADEMLERAQATGDVVGIRSAAYAFSFLFGSTGRYAEAAAAAEEAIVASDRIGGREGLLVSVYMRNSSLWHGLHAGQRDEQLRLRAREVADAIRSDAVGADVSLAAWHTLGEYYRVTGDFDTARAALAHLEASDNASLRAAVAATSAMIHLAAHDVDSARATMAAAPLPAEPITHYEHATPWDVAAAVLAACGKLGEAATVLGYAEGAMKAADFLFSPLMLSERAPTATACVDALGADEFARLKQVGAELSPGDALELVHAALAG